MPNANNNPLQVVYIVGGLPHVGGIERWLQDLTNYLPNYGVTPIIINLSGQGKMQPIFENAGITVYTTGKNYSAINTHRIDTLTKLIFVLRKINPDIIHTAHFSADYYGRLANIFVKKPIFVHIRNIYEEKKFWRRFSNKILSYLTTAYIAVSKEVSRSCIARYHNVAERPVHLLYNMTDKNKYKINLAPKDPLFPPHKKIIVGIGRHVPEKNFDRLIKAIKIAKKTVPDIHLALVGGGTERQNLQHYAKELKIENDVTFMGYRDDIPEILQNVDLIAMPSAYEGFGIAFLEAMYCGVPGILSKNTPIIEIAKECSLVTDTTPEDISQKIIKFLTDEKFYNQCSQKAREIAAQHTVENYIPNLLKIYNMYI